MSDTASEISGYSVHKAASEMSGYSVPEVKTTSTSTAPVRSSISDDLTSTSTAPVRSSISAYSLKKLADHEQYAKQEAKKVRDGWSDGGGVKRSRRKRTKKSRTTGGKKSRKRFRKRTTIKGGKRKRRRTRRRR